MRNFTYLTLLCAVVIVGLLAPPVMAAEIAPGDLVPFAVFPGSQENPDVDGNMVVWEDDRDGNKEIYFSNSPGTSGTRITTNSASQERPSISGDYIVWQDNRNGNWDIYLYRRSTGEETQLTTDPGKQWLPIVRGNYIAWYDSSSGDTRIVLYDIAAGEVKDTIKCDAKTTIPGGSTEFKPALSEKYVAWVEAADDRVHYYSIAEGKMKGPVSTSTAAQSWPSLYGSVVAWEDNRHASPDIYMIDLDDPSGGEQRITFDNSDQVSPVITGQILAWEDKRDAPRSIYMYDRNSGKEMAVPTAGGEQLYPAASGNMIVWQKARGSYSDIYAFAYNPEGAPAVVARIKVEPSSATMNVSDELKFNATCYDENDEVIPDLKVSWSCGNGTVGYIDPGGYFAAYEAGTTTIIASTGGITGTATVTVNANESVVTSIVVTPSTFTLDRNETKRFEATAYDQFGKGMTNIEFTWSCSNETVGTIGESSGVFTAKAAGTATVIATAEGITGTATVTVNDDEPVEPVLDRIEVTPSTFTLDLNATKQFTATAYDQFGKEMTDVEFNWSCSNETVGTIDKSKGLFTAKAAGTTTITATASGKSGMATVTVTDEEPVATTIEVTPLSPTLAIGGTEQFTATVLDQFGNEMTGVAVTWSCDNETVGTIGESSGIFTALAAGTATVTATAGDLSKPATVTVNADEPAEPALDRIEVRPGTAILDVGDTEQFAAVVFDENGGEMTGIEFTWSCDNETVGTVDDTGFFTALAAGTATVTASAGDVVGTATVTVNAYEPGDPALTEISLTPPRATLDVGDLQRFMVTVYDRDGNVMPAGEVTWSSSNKTVGTIDGDGFFTALAAGTTTVTATAGDCSAQATITVNEWPLLAKIAVVPSAATLKVGEDLQFEVVAFDRFGNIVKGAEVTWECSDPCVGTIDPCSGVFTALDSGTTTITACGDGAEGTATVTVTCNSPAVTSIVVTPAAITLAAGGTATFTVLDPDGCEIPDVEIDWCCSDTCVGEIDETGFFEAFAAGTATVTASANGVIGTADVEVTDESAGVVVSPSAIILNCGDTWRFTVYDLQDNAGSTMAWSCDDPCVGKIDPCSGLFTACGEGSTTVTATVAGENGIATVTVRSTEPVLTRIEVSPSDFRIPAGKSLTLTATAFDQYGYEMPDVIVNWTSSDPCVGEIDLCSGTFTALTEGEVTLTASADGVSGSACVTIEPSLPVPACIEVDPPEETLAPGETREFSATVYDQCENVMDWVRVRWSCSDGDIGTIDSLGLFAAFAQGSTDVTACAGGVEGAATITVTAAPTTDPTPGPTQTPNNPGSTYRAYSDGGGDPGPSFFAGICEDLKRGATHTFSGFGVTSIGSVAITAADNIPKLMLTVKEAGCPNLAEPPGGSTYEYAEIAVSWANPDQIGGATLTFTIPAKWLEEHGILPEDVRLMRYVNGGWQILETEVVGEEDGNYLFRATTPGFSTFAIAAMTENQTVTPETNVTTEATATPEVTETMTTAPTVAATTTPAAPLVYAPFLAPLAFLLWRRRKN